MVDVKFDQVTPRPAMKFHGALPRGLDKIPSSFTPEGRFGRMFRTLPALVSDGQKLIDLAVSMIERGEESDPPNPSNNPGVPAGYTYFGQFVDHDLTSDTTSQLQRQNDPDALENFRTPRFDLDNVYAGGPSNTPFMYDEKGELFILGKDVSGEEDDLPRANADDPTPGAWKRALIGDPRNDENTVVSQLHIAFLKYHNKLVKSGLDFAHAQATVRRHYNWILVHDFLPRIVGQQVVDDVLIPQKLAFNSGQAAPSQGRVWAKNLRFFDFKKTPFMPVEFSVAAYRFGHSMVRFNYSLNTATFGDDPVTKKGRELEIFDAAHPRDKLANDLRGFRQRPAGRTIEWQHFLKIPGAADPHVMQVARAFDTQISAGLGNLPSVVIGGTAQKFSNPGSLAARNLERGQALGLPSGQDVARAMGVPDELILSRSNKFTIGTGYKIKGGAPDPSNPIIAEDRKKELEVVFGDETPLWYYILKEAEVFCSGKTLGPVGGRIVAEVFIGLLLADPTCYLNVEPNWQPEKGQFGARPDGKFELADLVGFATAG